LLLETLTSRGLRASWLMVGITSNSLLSLLSAVYGAFAGFPFLGCSRKTHYCDG